MKSLIKISMAAFVLLFSAATAMAQGPRGEKMTPDQRAAKMAQRMTGELSLSADQTQKIEKIFAEHFKNMPQRSSGMKPGDKAAAPSGDRAEHMKKMNEQIKSVLTEAQYKKWQQQRAEMRAKMADRKGKGLGGRPAPSPAK